jgi:hypothetical protein
MDRGLISKKGKDSLAKRPPLTGISCSGPSDLDRAGEISSTKRRGTRGFYPLDPDPVVLTRAQPDLIPTAHFGSDGWRGKGMGSGPVAAIARRRCVPVTGARRTWSNPVVRGSNRLRLGSRMDYTTRVTLMGHRLGLAALWTAGAVAAAGRCGRGNRRCAFRA